MESFKSPRIADKPDVHSALILLEEWIENKMREQRLPGLSIGIVYDQDLIWARGFGYNNLEEKIPAQADSLYRIASNTKLFTSIALMQLRDQGKLRLDDPIAQYLPWFKIRYRHPDAPPITIRQLITHTSGLPRDAETPMWTECVFPDRETMIAALPDRETALPPETRWKYSNLAFALAGAIVEAVSGQAYADYIHQHIIEPLHMDSTTVIPDQSYQDRLSTGYNRPDRDGKRTPAPFMNAGVYAAAFGMASSVTDLARFVSMQFDHDQANPVLRGSTIKEMHRIQWIQDDWQSGWGLGFSIRRDGDKVWLGHGGGAPGHSTSVQFCPAEKFGVIVLTNVIAGDPMVYVQQVASLVMPVMLKALKEPEAVTTWNPAWNRYVGKYDNRWGEMFIGVENNRLVMRSVTFPDLPPGVLIPEGEHTFRMEKGGSDGELVVFEMDDAGKVKRMRIAGEYYVPAE